MSEPDDFNPYAPPKAEPLARPAKPERIKRPGAVKWALAFMVLSSALLIFYYSRLYSVSGLSLFWNNPWISAMEFTRIASSLGLLFGGRRPWVYWATVILLGIQTALIPKKIFILPDHLLGGQIALSIVALFFLLLFYKFTFGKPARAYFKVASARDLPLTTPAPPAP